jgi:hypothetical protein
MRRTVRGDQKRQQILDFIQQFTVEHGYPPDAARLPTGLARDASLNFWARVPHLWIALKRHCAKNSRRQVRQRLCSKSLLPSVQSWASATEAGKLLTWPLSGHFEQLASTRKIVMGWRDGLRTVQWSGEQIPVGQTAL